MSVAERWKARLRADLKTAMRDRDAPRISTLRELLAALDNAEAIPVEGRHDRYVVHRFGAPGAEAERKVLTEHDVRAILTREGEERRAAAGAIRAGGRATEADALEQAAALVDGYLALRPD